MTGNLKSKKMKINKRSEIFIAWVIGSPTINNSSVLRCWYDPKQVETGRCKTHLVSQTISALTLNPVTTE
jgi:hypothetical protein